MDASPKGRILRAAAHLFVTEGFAKTTVRQLAAAVGIQSGSLFHHFQNKEEILEAVMVEVILLNTELMRVAAASTDDPRARVRALVVCELNSIHGETSEAMGLLMLEWRSLPPQAQTRVLVLRDVYEQIWLDALRGFSHGLVAIDPFILRRLVTGMLGHTGYWYRQAGPMSIETLADQVMSLLTRDQRASA